MFFCQLVEMSPTITGLHLCSYHGAVRVSLLVKIKLTGSVVLYTCAGQHIYCPYKRCSSKQCIPF